MNDKITLIIDGKKILVDQIELPKITYDRIQIGGETDEQMATRRNTFIRWLFGQPKEKKGAPVYTTGRVNISDLILTVTGEDSKQYFDNWWQDMAAKNPCSLYEYKRDIIIEQCILRGVFIRSIDTFVTTGIDEKKPTKVKKYTLSVDFTEDKLNEIQC